MEGRLKGILKWSLEQQGDGVAGGEAERTRMDPERMEWLKEALHSISSQPSETDLLKAALTIVKTHSADTAGDSQGVAATGGEQLQAVKGAFEEIQYFIEDMDHANDLIPLGGVPVIMGCLQYPDSDIVKLSCELIATATQNNTKCQEAFLSSIPRLLDIVRDTSSSDELKTKALYALSCLSREYEPGLLELLKHDGFSVLLQCIRSTVRKCVIKALFMFMSFYSPATGETAQGSLKELLPLLVTELTGVLKECKDVEILEHLLSTISTLLTYHCGQTKTYLDQNSEIKDILREKRSLLVAVDREEEVKLLDKILSDL